MVADGTDLSLGAAHQGGAGSEVLRRAGPIHGRRTIARGTHGTLLTGVREQTLYTPVKAFLEGPALEQGDSSLGT